jgi:putative addiction module antidote
MQKLKLIKIGNSVGVILPKDLLSKLKVAPGDSLVMTEAEDGVRLTAHDPEVERQIEAGREIMGRYRHTLRALAK